MDVIGRNNEGNSKPTVSEEDWNAAMQKSSKPIVYICSPYSGDVDRNIEKACRYSRFAVEEGYVPITPHLWMPLFISEETEREMAISLDLRLIDVCSELWVCGDVISDGMRREMDYAAETGTIIQYIKEEDLYVRN